MDEITQRARASDPLGSRLSGPEAALTPIPLSLLKRPLPAALIGVYAKAPVFEVNGDGTVDFLVDGSGLRARQVKEVMASISAAGYAAKLMSAPRRVSVFPKGSPTHPIYSEHFGLVRAIPTAFAAAGADAGLSPRRREA